ncbi:MAG: sigma-70 family RNA polymerase sigma factor [Bacteroidota bacterium]
MTENQKKETRRLAAHFFRNEYGRLVAVIAHYLGGEHVETAEDIVQETLAKAVSHWEIKGIPKNPKSWLYATAKNLTINVLNRKKHHRTYISIKTKEAFPTNKLEFSEEVIEDGLLRMMFATCHPSISEKYQIPLVLKILSGFSIPEIADAFFTSNETINKRLVRERKQLRKVDFDQFFEKDIQPRANNVLKTIYLMFNEGYFPSRKNQIIRYDLCLEAIRLVKLLNGSTAIQDKTNCHALLALMYFNCASFKSRISKKGTLQTLKQQDRSLWNMKLIQMGVQHLRLLNMAQETSKFALLATISANHCMAQSFEATNWNEILSLYDRLLLLEDSPITHLNRCVALAYVAGNLKAIMELNKLKGETIIDNYYLFHLTLAELYQKEGENTMAEGAYRKALELAQNSRDTLLIEKKLYKIVPI